MMETEVLGRHLIVEGFRNVKVENIDVFLDLVKEGTANCYIQFFDAKMIAGFDHLYFATLNALKAFDMRLSVSKNLAVEVLLFASGQHQIKKAVELLGVKPDSSQIVALIVAKARLKAVKASDYISTLLQGEKCDEVVELTDEKMDVIKEAFGITDLAIEATLRRSEKEALTSLLIERAALLLSQR